MLKCNLKLCCWISKILTAFLLNHKEFVTEICNFTADIISQNSFIMYGELGVLVTWSVRCMLKTLTEIEHEVKTTCFWFSSFKEVILGNKADWWVKYFRYIYLMQWQIQLAPTVMAHGVQQQLELSCGRCT
jgi:hypothetical protein